MKKICLFALVLALIVSLTACAKVEISMQEIYDAAQTEAMLENHQSVYVRDVVDGENFGEKYLTKDYVYDYIHIEDFEWLEFVSDDAIYNDFEGNYICFLPISPDGLKDCASYRAERYASLVLGVDTPKESIESVSKKDGRIVVTSFLDEEIHGDISEEGISSGKFEYTLDAKSHELMNLKADVSYEDGNAISSVSEVSYDVEAPEKVKELVEYTKQTENLRNITVVNKPGTDKEISQSVQAPKGLPIGFNFDVEFEFAVEFYTDADCTEVYDPFADTDSDLSIYVKWLG